jgi:hypothetical protein
VRELIESLVREALEELVAHKLEKTSRLPKVFILLSEEPSKYSEVPKLWEHVNELTNKYEVTLGVGGAWSEIPDHIDVSNVINVEESKHSLPLVLEQADILYLPVLSLGLIAKLAYSIDDDLPSRWTISAQLKGKSIVLAKDELQLQSSNPLATSFTVQTKVNNYLRTLRQDGMTISTTRSAIRTIDIQLKKQSDRRPLLLVKHIEAAWEHSESYINVPKSTIIGPLAKDRAKELGIGIFYDKPEMGNQS